MSATATLARPPVAGTPSRAVALAPPQRVGALRVALVLLTFSLACFAVGASHELVVGFGGSVATLHVAASYWDGGAALAAWLCVLAATCAGYRAAVDLAWRRASRVALATAAVGAVLLATAQACVVWATAIQLHSGTTGGDLSHPFGISHGTHEVLELSKAEWAFVAAGWLVFAVAAALARPTGDDGASSRPRRRALGALAVAAALAAVSPAATFVVELGGRRRAAGQLDVVFVYDTQVLPWLAAAVALWLVAVALRHTPRTRSLAAPWPLAVVGAVCLAASAGAFAAIHELLVTAPGNGWSTTLTRLEDATAWAGWVLLVLAVGIVATRLRSIMLQGAARSTVPA